jgi:hypothetical protein
MRRFFVKSVTPLDELEQRHGRALHIYVPLQALNRDSVRHLANLFAEHPGSLPTYVHVNDPASAEVTVWLGDQVRVEPSLHLRHAVAEIFGGGASAHVAA